MQGRRLVRCMHPATKGVCPPVHGRPTPSTPCASGLELARICPGPHLRDPGGRVDHLVGPVTCSSSGGGGVVVSSLSWTLNYVAQTLRHAVYSTCTHHPSSTQAHKPACDHSRTALSCRAAAWTSAGPTPHLCALLPPADIFVLSSPCPPPSWAGFMTFTCHHRPCRLAYFVWRPTAKPPAPCPAHPDPALPSLVTSSRPLEATSRRPTVNSRGGSAFWWAGTAGLNHEASTQLRLRLNQHNTARRWRVIALRTAVPP